VSGNEPILTPAHLIELISLEQAGYLYILEMNGILVDRRLAEGLPASETSTSGSPSRGRTRGEFSCLTGAVPEAFGFQLEALRNLLDAGVPCHPAVMLSFSPLTPLRG